jgi:GNAT superfamily N-acetyltransferase
MNLLLREFVETDRERLRELFVSARDAAFSWSSSGAHKLEDFDTVTEGEKIVVALVSNDPIGFASIWEPDSFLHNLFVHPHFQRQGVGKALLAHCEKYFAGIPTLKCVKANEHARRFYQAQGWTVHSEATGPDGPYVLMERASPDKVTSCVPSAQDAAKPRPL